MSSSSSNLRFGKAWLIKQADATALLILTDPKSPNGYTQTILNAAPQMRFAIRDLVREVYALAYTEGWDDSRENP